MLGGHDHIYTRTELMEGNTPVTSGGAPGDVLPIEDGQTMYVTGTSSSGSKFYPYVDSEGGTDPALAYDSTAVWSQNERAGYSNIQITADSLQITTHNSDDNSLVDDVTLVRSEGTTEPVPTDDGTPAPTDDVAPTEPGPTETVPAQTDGAAGAGGQPEAGDDLAPTGDDGMVPFLAAGVALAVVGGATLFGLRRRRQV